jgi:hypothetical protein
MANNRHVGKNTRLIEQKGAYGHCALSVASICTARRVLEFVVEGKVQEENYLLHDVEEEPFQDLASDGSVAFALNQKDIEIREAWKELVRLGINHRAATGF